MNPSAAHRQLSRRTRGDFDDDAVFHQNQRFFDALPRRKQCLCGQSKHVERLATEISFYRKSSGRLSGWHHSLHLRLAFPRPGPSGGFGGNTFDKSWADTRRPNNASRRGQSLESSWNEEHEGRKSPGKISPRPENSIEADAIMHNCEILLSHWAIYNCDPDAALLFLSEVFASLSRGVAQPG